MSKLIGLVAALSCATLTSVSAEEAFELKSAAFEDNGFLQKKHAGKNPNNPNCIGDNISPPLNWSQLPVGTKSLAILMHDQQGANGLGVSHWIAYGISPRVTGFAEGETSIPSEKFVGGKNTPGTSTYFGPCPPPGSGQHHYVITLIATDLEPTALMPGLTQEQLLQALKGHAKGAAGLIGRFGEP